MLHHALQTRLRTLPLIAALLCLVTTASCQPITTKQTEGEKYNGLKETTVQTTNNISRYRAKDMYAEIETLLKQFNDLYKKVQQATDTDAIILDIETNITAMAGCYRKLASMEIDVAQVFNKDFATLTSTHATTAGIVESAQAEITQYEKAIAELEKALQRETNAIEKRKKEITIGGNRSKINSIQNRKVIWDLFSAHQDMLLKTLGTNRENIGLLFHALRTNAEVYEEAAKTIQLRRNAVDSLGNLKGFANIESLLADILNTQLAVDDIVTKISSAEFNPDRKQAKSGL